MFVSCAQICNAIFGDKKQKPQANTCGFVAGGDEGNRTPVRKPLDITFFGCRLSFALFLTNADNQALERSSHLVLDRCGDNSRCKFTTDFTLSPKSWYSQEERAVRRPRHCHCKLPKESTIRQPLQLYCCRLFFNFRQLKRLPGSTRLSYLKIPVETFTSPLCSRRAI